MSVASLVLNRGLVKLMAALAIPTGIGWFFIYSQQQANLQVQEYKDEQKSNPTTSKIVIKDYALKEVDDSNRIRWQLVAKSGEASPESQEVSLTDVKVEYFDPATGALKVRLIAPFGAAREATRHVLLSGGRDRWVTAEGGGGHEFRCRQVELIKKNQFLATGGVIIDWPGVAKVSGNSASGSIEMANGPKDLKISGNTHAQIVVR